MSATLHRLRKAARGSVAATAPTTPEDEWVVSRAAGGYPRRRLRLALRGLLVPRTERDCEQAELLVAESFCHGGRDSEDRPADLHADHAPELGVEALNWALRPRNDLADAEGTGSLVELSEEMSSGRTPGARHIASRTFTACSPSAAHASSGSSIETECLIGSASDSSCRSAAMATLGLAALRSRG